MSRPRNLAAIALSSLSLTGIAGLAAPDASATSGTTWTVDNGVGADCSDAQQVASATPLCTITGAVKAAQPGDTIVVRAGQGYSESVYVAKSQLTIEAAAGGAALDGSFYIDGQSDLTISGFSVNAASQPTTFGNAFYVRNSTNIIVSKNSTANLSGVAFSNVTGGQVSDNAFTAKGGTAVEVAGSSGVTVSGNKASSPITTLQSDVVITHNTIDGVGGNSASGPISALDVQGGSGVTISGNLITCSENDAIDVRMSATGSRIIGNTVLSSSGTGIDVNGSTGNTIENNIVAEPDTSCQLPASYHSGISAPSGSTAVEDYNIVDVSGGRNFVTGGGTSAWGAGAHDLDVTPGLDGSGAPLPGSWAIDSADSSAPGEPDTDLFDMARHEDLGTPNIGSGSRAFDDRGAVEFQGTTPAGTTRPVPVPPGTATGTNPPVTGQVSVSRIWGMDRYGTAIAVSQSQWASGSAKAVVLARGDEFPDALAGVPFASHVHGPLLLTDPKSLASTVDNEIARVLGPAKAGKTVYIAGGTGAVSTAVEGKLRAEGYTVVRFDGATRFATALKIAAAYGPTSEVMVATGYNFPDALAAGPLGAAKNAPLVLSEDTALDPATAAFVGTHHVVDAIGTQALTAVNHSAGPAGRVVNGYYGGDRFVTAASVAQGVIAATGHASGLGVATGFNFPDSLTGGAYAAIAGEPLMLTDPRSVSPQLLWTLNGMTTTLKSVQIFGGQKAVPQGIEDAITAALRAAGR